MSRLRAQIRHCMHDLRKYGDSEATARFVFPPEFIGFQGHFPGRPVLPAVCEIQATVAMLEAWRKKRVKLKEIISAKFSTPVTCDEEVVYSCALAMEDDRMAVSKTTVTKDGGQVATFRLRVVFENETQGC